MAPLEPSAEENESKTERALVENLSLESFESQGSVYSMDESSSTFRANVQKRVFHRLSSLTAFETSFVNDLLATGNEDELKLLEQSLQDENVFGRSSIKSAPAVPTRRGSEVGSAKRAERFQKRKSCLVTQELWKRAKVRQLWKTTTLKVIASNRFKEAFGLLGKSSSEWDETLSGHHVAQDKNEERETPSDLARDDERSPFRSRRDLLTRVASQNLYKGEGFEIGDEELFSMYGDPNYDPWDEETDREGHEYEFHILGTSHDDPDAQPHVLSPPLMHTLQKWLPNSKKGESFWLKYSLVRDGACLDSFLQNLRGSSDTILAIETLDGEVFGAFNTTTWTIQPSYFGGSDSFLWRMTHSRNEVAASVLEQALRETDVEIFPHTHENPFTQMCQHDMIAIGGGSTTTPRTVATGVTCHPNEFGFGIAFSGDYLMEATSEPCITFNSPSLCKAHSDGSKFEVLNLEVWALTPCITLLEAQRMECKKLFLKQQSSASERSFAR